MTVTQKCSPKGVYRWGVTLAGQTAALPCRRGLADESKVTCIQCFGSRSARIRVFLPDPDPDSHKIMTIFARVRIRIRMKNNAHPKHLYLSYLSIMSILLSILYSSILFILLSILCLSILSILLYIDI